LLTRHRSRTRREGITARCAPPTQPCPRETVGPLLRNDQDHPSQQNSEIHRHFSAPGNPSSEPSPLPSQSLRRSRQDKPYPPKIFGPPSSAMDSEYTPESE